ncbi:MAG TPA: CPXCG motif-containing cysteine-rich protein [Porticoccaceae bacterium]|nr:CPXCG motif-containing cysteine-rich protein [Porticoccaceae bacterium]
MLESYSTSCPYCGEIIELLIDCSISHQVYIEDCAVCCRPIVIDVLTCDGGVAELSARDENEAY